MSKLILCNDINNGIGKNNSIPWYSKEDFQHFKNETLNHIVMMGYNTWLSLPSKPLSDRLNVIVTSKIVDNYFDNMYNVIYIPKEHVVQFLQYNPNTIVIGGKQLYEMTIKYVDEIILSRIHGQYDCDCFFNIFDYDVKLELTHTKSLSSMVDVFYYNNIKDYNENSIN